MPKRRYFKLNSKQIYPQEVSCKRFLQDTYYDEKGNGRKEADSWLWLYCDENVVLYSGNGESGTKAFIFALKETYHPKFSRNDLNESEELIECLKAIPNQTDVEVVVEHDGTEYHRVSLHEVDRLSQFFDIIELEKVRNVYQPDDSTIMIELP